MAVKDDKWGERPYAFVTIKSGGGEENVTGESLLAWAKKSDQISGFMLPKAVEVIDELPKTSTGKVRKNVLRDWASGGKREGEGGG